MKIRKLLFLSLFLILGTMLFMPNEINAVVVLGREITIDGASLVPHLGQIPGILPDTECYEVVEQKWTLENFDDFTKFEEGKTYMFTAKLKPKEGYEFSANTYYNFLNMEWIEERGGYLYDDGTVDFEGICTPVKTYKLTITADEGINVSPVGIMDIYTGYSKEIVFKNNKGYDLKSVKVNGEEKIFDVEYREIEVTTGEFSFVEVLTVDCVASDIKVVVESRKVIEKVEITGYVAPEVGHTPEVSDLNVPAEARYEISSACWGTHDATDEFGAEASFNQMLSDETFKEGEIYALKVVIRSRDTDWGFFEGTEVTIDGRRIGGVQSDSELEVYLEFGGSLKLNYFLNNTENQEFLVGAEKNLTFTLDYPKFFGRVFVDDKELYRGSGDYIWEFAEGNFPSVELSEEYIQTLELGKHTIKFIFSDGMEAETTFTINKLYKLILDANEGKFSDGKTKLEFDDVTKCDMTKIEKPVKDGYTFKGWFTEKTDGKSIEIVMSSEDGIKEDMTFYAQWKENSGGVPPTTGEGTQPDNDDNNTVAGSGSGSASAGNTNTNKPTGNNPQTGDGIVLFTVISLIAVVGIITTIKVKKYVKE